MTSQLFSDGHLLHGSHVLVTIPKFVGAWDDHDLTTTWPCRREDLNLDQWRIGDGGKNGWFHTYDGAPTFMVCRYYDPLGFWGEWR